MDAATTPNPVAIPTVADPTPPTPPIDLETTPEFQTWKQAKLNEVSAYLRDNWRMDVGVEQSVMAPQFVFPDRENRRAYASVSAGQSFRGEDGAIAINPATGQSMTYTVWRKIQPPAQPLATATDPTIEDAKPDVQPTDGAA